MPDHPPPPPADLALLGQYWETYRPRLMAMVRSRIAPTLGRVVDPDDILADAYIDSRRKWPDFGQQTLTPYAWLYRIVMDRLIETYRKTHRGPTNLDRRQNWPERSSAEFALHLSRPGVGPRTAAEQAEQRTRVHAALEDLEPLDREILWLRYFDQLTLADVAALLEIEPAAARKRFERALRRLSEVWAAGGGP